MSEQLEEHTQRPTPGRIEERALDTVSVAGQRIRGVIPFGVESRDMGGWREVIEPTALRTAKLDDLVATVDHTGVPIGRYPGTLEVEERSDGLHWSVEPPASRADIREAVERGDLKSGSWRMVVGRDEWRGDVRHVHEIAELRDVAVVCNPAYPAARIELRSQPDKDRNRQEQPNLETETEAPQTTTPTSTTGDTPSATSSTSTLTVEDRASRGTSSLTAAFRNRGFPGETATISWGEFRTAQFSGDSGDELAPIRQTGVPLGQDQRYAHPAFAAVAVEAGTTSVQVLRQASRYLPAADEVVRALDASEPKPEVDTTVELVTVSMKQVAAVENGVVNILMEQDMITSLIETDLRLALNEGLDKLVLDAVADSGYQDPASDPLLVSIRKSITTIQAAGYAPDTLILTPADAEDLDLLTSDGPEAFWTFGAGRFAPGQLFGLSVRISKTAEAPVVVDASAFGKLYSSPISLARFEENSGSTNTSTVRLEGHAAFGTERQAAAVRIAAS